jgi:hypothetical protein
MGFFGMPYLITLVLLLLGIILRRCLIEPIRVKPVLLTCVFWFLFAKESFFAEDLFSATVFFIFIFP